MSKWKNKGLWVSLTGAVIIGVQAVLAVFGVTVAPEKYEEVIGVVNAILLILTILGVVSNPEDGTGFVDESKTDKPTKHI